jgi:4-amino-4-deoxy-L-arabinose transferase-like glycosyltransferase
MSIFKKNKLDKKHYQLAIVIGLVALILRVLFTLFYPASPLAGGDQLAFWSFGQGITEGNGFRSDFEPWLADRPPLYSYFLAGVFTLFGEREVAVFLVQSLIGAIASSLFYLCSVRILGDQRGLVAGVLFVILPHFLLFTKQILTEAIYIPMLVLLLVVLLLSDHLQSKSLYWFIPGVLLGLIGLVRREALLPGFLIAIFGLWRTFRPTWSKVGIALVPMIVGVAVSTTPWILRNYGELGLPLLSSSAGINFLVGNNPNGSGSYSIPPHDWVQQFTDLDELERNDLAWDLSLNWIKANTTDFLSLLPKKLGALFMPGSNFILDLTDLGLLVLSIFGVIRVLQKRKGWQWVGGISLSLIGSAILVTLVFVGGWRYRLVMYPGILLLTAMAIPEVWLQSASPILQWFPLGNETE